MSIDDADLVKEIKLNPMIWDKNDINYSSQINRVNTWKKIADNLNTTPQKVMGRWKSLRSAFLRCYKHNSFIESNNRANPVYKDLKFLIPSLENNDDETNNIDDADLVKEIKLNPMIWDKNDINYSSQINRVNTWEKIADNLNSTSHKVKGRWKSLRNAFLKCYKNNGFNETIIKGNPVYKDLEFLIPSLEKNDAETNTSSNFNTTMVEGSSDNTVKNNIDDANLVKEIELNPMIWDKNDINYKNQTNRVNTWKKIAENLNTTPKKVMVRWKSLRAAFLRYYKNNGLNETNPKANPVYKNLNFLIPSLENNDDETNTSSNFNTTIFEGTCSDNTVCTSFINLVKEHPIIYDTTHKNYRNQKIREEHWKEIANEMKVPFEDLIPKWHLLRDNYRRALFGETKCGIKRSLYFEHLDFLKPHIKKNDERRNDKIKLLLIEKVKSHPVIWDTNNENYQKRAPTYEAWDKIVEELHIEEKNLTRKDAIFKWTYLRKQLGTYLRWESKENKTVFKEYPLYKEMKFLIPHYQKNKESYKDNFDVNLRSLVINEVATRPQLWNSTHKNYKNDKVSNKSWGEIAEQLQMPKKEIIEMWKSIKLNFYVQINKCFHEKKKIRGYYIYNDLKFLVPEIRRRKPEYNEVVSSDDGNDDKVVDELNWIDDEDIKDIKIIKEYDKKNDEDVTYTSQNLETKDTNMNDFKNEPSTSKKMIENKKVNTKTKKIKKKYISSDEDSDYNAKGRKNKKKRIKKRKLLSESESDNNVDDLSWLTNNEEKINEVQVNEVQANEEKDIINSQQNELPFDNEIKIKNEPLSNSPEREVVYSITIKEEVPEDVALTDQLMNEVFKEEQTDLV